MSPLYALFLGVIGAQYWLAQLPPLLQFSGYIGSHFLLFMLMGIAYQRGPSDSKRWLWIGIASRLLLIPLSHFTSYDVDRYLWDGFVAHSGWDPYQVTPESLAGTNPDWPLPKDNLQYPTIYPPLAMAFFSACTLLPWWGALLAWKAVAALASSLAVLLIGKTLAGGRDHQKLALVALNPILILESGVGAHLDSVLILFLAMAIYFGHTHRPLWATFSLTLGVLIKFSPLVCLAVSVLTLLSQSRFTQALRHLAVAGLVLLVGYGFAYWAGWSAVGSLHVFFRKWEFGSPISFFLGSILSQPSANQIRLLILGGWLLWVGINKRPLLTKWQWALCALYLLSPVSFPWYLMPLCVLLPFAGTTFVLLWTLVAPLSYEVMVGYETHRVWAPQAWPMGLVVAAWGLSIFLTFCPQSVPLNKHLKKLEN